MLLAMCFVILTACQTSDQSSPQGQSMKKEVISQQEAVQAEKTVESLEQVEEATAVSLDKDVYIHLSVTGFDRFFLKDIRKEAEKSLETKASKENIHVSTDKKIELEIKELKEKLKEQGMTKEQMKTELEKIDKDMKG